VSGLDLSWNNFHIGDLLVTPSAIIVNTGYPHWACWKYAVRAGEDPKAHLNSAEGAALRARGIKGAVLLRSPASVASISVDDPVCIVHKGTADYDSILQTTFPPLEEGTELVFRMHDQVMRATAHDSKAYIDLLVFAGTEAAKLDAKKYRRTLPDIAKQALGLMPPSVQICEAAKSGDGSIENVGIKVNGTFQCAECRQKFDSDMALKLHWNFIHDPHRHQED